ncbi:AMP-dependent synthetase/ligase [Rhodococcus erythropolis]|uniref:AMP-dependent synthetase/ligase n=1 Tax=Rhodococcus erythropolis TaxID=1833 RepID=UPI001E55555E|nr:MULTISPECIES: AMP-dependent synthetase/ligase [Rhodococcus erythropolis group]MCD2104587.1 AMP-dependent synthetase/ligase [Rhodococcus qingshengii]MCZ4525288.1 AMP-dependent synthetase/ligase [Rhodococcus erythropolis]
MNPQSFSGPGVELVEKSGLSSIIFDAADRTPGRPSLREIGQSESLTCLEVADRVRNLASALVEAGVDVGERVAVLGRTSLDWVVLDLAVLAVGGVVVPVYPTSSPEQIRHIVADSGSTHFAAESEFDAERLRDAGAATVLSFEAVSQWSRSTSRITPDDRIAAVHRDDLAMIVYTSGTTGPAKGCMLSHRNMFAAAANTVVRTGDMFGGTADEPTVTALGLPLAHVFGQTILFATLYGGSETHLLPGIPDTVAALPRIKPTFLALVPYALEKIRKAARPHLEDGVEDAAVSDGLTLLRSGKQASVAVPARPVLGMLGGRLRSVISGGASLDDSTAGFYAGFGVDILNCYGMTESATAVTVNEPKTNRVGTVGRPIPGTTLAIAPDGEVLVRGANVTRGYWGAAADRSPVDADGWLHTGDIGELDDGYLRITGRKKEILVTSGGKNVAPTPLEDRIRLHPLVSNAVVIGDGRAYVAALITLDPAAFGLDDALVRAELQAAVDDANSLVSRAESIRQFRVLPVDFTVDSGLLTSSLKLKRAAIEAAFATEIADIYDMATPQTVR